jgi:hypothetical protein
MRCIRDLFAGNADSCIRYANVQVMLDLPHVQTDSQNTYEQVMMMFDLYVNRVIKAMFD